MDAQIEAYYNQIYEDLTVSPEEASDLEEYFTSLNPPPDKLIWLRATAFRLACDFLSDDDNDQNVKLLRAINAIVHSLETTCMVPAHPGGNSEYNAEAFEEFLKGVYADASVDQEENVELLTYFKEHIPEVSHLVSMRALIFKTACEFLGDDKDANTQLLRCVNVIVHNFERTVFSPKEYELKLEFDLDVSLSDAVQEMWKLDVNRLRPGSDYEVNVQGGKKPYWKEDSAPDPLFTSVSREAFRDRNTYKYFVALLDNYTGQTGSEEQVTSIEKREMDLFLKAIMQTAPMQYCHKYLMKHGDDISSSSAEFQRLLYKIWFELYRRGTNRDSSGFEHVFVGEIKDEKVSGMHNWVRYYLEEKAGNIDYRGYIKPRGHNEAETNEDDHVLTLQFNWHGFPKMVGTSFIGTSPEFEMALYTTCFLLGEEDNNVTLDTGTDVFDLNIRCYKIAGGKIGTAFPEATAHHD